MKKRTPAIIGLCVGLALLLGGGIPIMYRFLSTNIVGGAGWFTFYIKFVSTLNGWAGPMVLFGGAIALCSVPGVLFPQTVRDHCTPRTSLLMLLISLLSGIGLSCFYVHYTLGDGYFFPNQFAVSVAGSIVSLFAVTALSVVYGMLRAKNPRVKGVVIEVVSALLFVLPFSYVWFRVWVFLELIF